MVAGILLIIVGFMIARAGADNFMIGESGGGQSDAEGLITLLVQLFG